MESVTGGMADVVDSTCTSLASPVLEGASGRDPKGAFFMRFIDHFLTSPLFWSKLCNMASCIGSQYWRAGEVRMQSTNTLMRCHPALTVASLMSCTTAARCFSPNTLMSCAVRRCRAFPLGSGTPVLQ